MQITVGSELTLTYDLRVSDRRVVVGTVVKVWDGGGFDFLPVDEPDVYSVTAGQLARGEVTIDPKQADPIYPYDVPGDFHDLARCGCGGHCLNCGYVLSGRQRCYCSNYCGQRYRAEIRLDALLAERLA
jgi:hypothetical protein